MLSARWSKIIYGVLYNLILTCLDTTDPNPIPTDDHSFNAELKFVLTMPTSEPTTTISTSAITSKSTSVKTSTKESAALTTPRQTSTTSITSWSTQLDTSKPSIISVFMSHSKAPLFLTKSSTPKLIATSLLLQQTTSVIQSSKLPNYSTNTALNSPSATAISGVLGSVSMTASTSSSMQVNIGFFSKPENIVTVVLPAVAFSGLAIFGIGYFIYKKGLNKTSITPVIGL